MERLVCIRRAIAALVMPCACMASCNYQAITRLIARADTSSSMLSSARKSSRVLPMWGLHFAMADLFDPC